MSDERPIQLIVHLRAPRSGDGADLAAIWIDVGTYYTQLAPDLFQIPDADGLAEELEAWIVAGDGNDHFALVAEYTDHVVGFIYATLLLPAMNAAHQFVRDSAYPRLNITALIVQQAYWRHQIGSKLLTAAEAWGRKKDAVLAVLDTYSESPISIPFYEQRMGYQRRGVHLRKVLSR